MTSGDQIPPVSRQFTRNTLTLLDRLRAWPRYEPDEAEHCAAIHRWRTAVLDRRSRGAPRRVLFVHGQLPGETGSGVYMQQITAEALRQGVDMYVLSAGYHPLNTSDIPGVPDERIFTCLFTPEGRQPKPDAVKTPISGMSVVMPYPVLAYRDRTDDQLLDLLTVFGHHIARHVCQLQPDVIHVDHLWFLNGLARLVAPWIPLVASAHGTAHKLIVDSPRFRELVVPCVASADHVCAISPESVQECQTMFAVSPACISIEGYGYEPDLFHYRPVDRRRVIREAFGYDLSPEEILVVSVGKFVDWKGFKELALAIGYLRETGCNATAIIVGEGDTASRADLEAFIAARALAPRVRLPGKVQRTLLPDIYRAADVYVLPSHIEPYGLVLMEALACGTPAVAANVGGPPAYVPQTLRDEGVALLVPPITLTETGTALPPARAIYARHLADGITAILHKAINPADRNRIAEAMTHLTWHRLVTSLISIYDRLSTQKIEKARKQETFT